MRFLAIGDEKVELKYLEKILQNSMPDCDFICFTEPAEALEYIAGAQTKPLDYQDHEKEVKKFQISCFGEFSIYYGGNPVNISSKKAYELIAYLIIHHGHPVSKWEAASRLWENSEDFRARDSLYKVLKKIKQTEKEIGCSLVHSEKQKIYLEKDKIQCTLWEFEEFYHNKPEFPTFS